MSAQYDAIAEQYRRSKKSPIRTHVEAYTFERLVGDVDGLAVLDLACGEGFYSRRLRRGGAATVIGVDVSPEMIRLARERELADQLGIEYVCAPVGSMPDLGSFDLVAAAYLLHYAEDADELFNMCRRIAAQLSPGGRFIALNENPGQADGARPGYDQYGFSKQIESPCRDGSKISYWMISGREVFQFDARWYSRDTYERALREAGFAQVRWCPLELDPAGVAEYGEQYWQAYLDNPPVIGLDCRL